MPLGAPTVHMLPELATGRPSEPRTSAHGRLTRAAPRGYVAWIERQIVYAGRAGEWTAARFLAIKIATSIAPIVIGILLIVAEPSPFRIAVGGCGIFLALIAPEVFLNARADDRQKEIQRALPDTLDQMTIAVEAGLGFDAAMLKAVAHGRGALAEELVRTLQDVSIGRSRRDAYRALERRTNAEDLRRFVRAVVQADQYGISIADVLRVQSGEMRVKRRQRAEEQAVKVPVKIVFPLVFCILPVLFIVLLTPAVLGIIRAFS
ncbi:MAG TPA: type II secretion system F family protein [Pseudolysinimonas sp.]|nr:type II secretion system F family protein [Pseudolysinimonas sp.]